MAENVAVFIDWQNVYKAARSAFDLAGLPNERGNFSPYALSQVLAAGMTGETTDDWCVWKFIEDFRPTRPIRSVTAPTAGRPLLGCARTPRW